MTAHTLGIVVALPQEARSLGRRTPNTGMCVAGDGYSLICVAGTGPRNAHTAARRLIDRGVRALLSWGCAGALQRDLQAGAVCIPHTVRDEHGGVFPADRQWHSRVIAALPGLEIHNEDLVTTQHMLADATAKARLAECTHAIAVDMESATIAAAAAAHALPFLAVRSIADTADMTLPHSVRAAIDADGRLDLLRFAGSAWRRPQEWRELVRLRQCFNRALQALTRVAHELGDHFGLVPDAR